MKKIKESAKNVDLSANVEYITDRMKIMEYSIMSMPAFVVNNRIVSAGKVIRTAEIVRLLERSGGEIG